MKLSQATKSVGYLQAHAPDMLRELADGASSYIITDGGEARAVMLDIHSYEALQDSLALLKMLTISSQHVREGKISDVDDTFARLRGFEKDAYRHDEVFDEIRQALFTVKEAAEYLEVTEMTVRGWVKSGKLAGQKIGRRLGFDPDMLKQFKRALPASI